MNKFFGHLKTIMRHKHLVRKFCFKCGLYGQGMRHDLSKYSPTEFFAGVKYFQGTRSPNDMERRTNGYSKAWLHHKGRNKHHWEYWQDYVVGVGIEYIPMPDRYIYEMACDRIAACRVYHGAEYKASDALDYFEKSNAKNTMHKNTAEKLRKLLKMAAENGEEAMFAEIKAANRASKDKKS